MFTSSTKQPSHPVTQDKQIARLWREFNRQFKTEKDCMEAIYKILKNEKALSCKNCESKDWQRAYGERLRNCSSCGREVSITAGTFFDGIRQARPWMAAIWFMEQGIILSAHRFHKLLEIAYSTAWMIQRKLSFILNSLIEEEESAVIVSAEIFTSAICKRSRETPAQKHPKVTAGSNPSNSKFDQQAGRSNPTESGILPSPRMIRDTFHGVSRKYLQIYLALIWCRTDREQGTTKRLFAHCARFRQVLDREILSLCSERQVKVIPAANAT